jgi:uncharacterized membrane protein HdeD (DUF308 family)
VAAANEVMVGAMMSSRGGRIARGLLAVLFVVAGVVAFLGVKVTIVGLGAVMSVLFICWGAIGVLAALAARREHGWWVLLMPASPSSQSGCRSLVRRKRRSSRC